MVWPSTAGADVSLVFGTYAADKPSDVVRQLRPSLNEIAKNASTVLGEPVEIRMHVVRSYEEGVELITSGRVDFARLGPVSYVIAKNANPGLSILATERKNGGKVFKGIIIVAKDSPIGDASQLRGKSFAFGNENSTIAPKYSTSNRLGGFFFNIRPETGAWFRK